MESAPEKPSLRDQLHDQRRGRNPPEKRGALLSEAFVNDADGYKVGFLEKPTDWNHTGKPKHDQPMLGKTWIGPIELDASSGAKQVQVAVPIWSEGKPVGSLVAGLNVFQLSATE